MEPITVDIKYSSEDLQKSYELHYKVFYPIMSKLVLILGILLSFIGLLLLFINHFSYDTNSSWLGWFYIVLGGLAVAYHFWKIKTMGKKMFNRMPDFQAPHKMIINDSGINAKSTTVSSEAKWEHYQKAVLSNEMILLYINPFRFNIFPKKNFKENDFEKLKGTVKARINLIKQV